MPGLRLFEVFKFIQALCFEEKDFILRCFPKVALFLVILQCFLQGILFEYCTEEYLNFFCCVAIRSVAWS